VAIAVVDVLEAIQVQKGHRQRLLAPHAVRHGLLQPVGQQHAVGQVRQHVKVRHLGQLLVDAAHLRVGGLQLGLAAQALCDVANDHAAVLAALTVSVDAGADLGRELAAIAPGHGQQAGRLPYLLAPPEQLLQPGVGGVGQPRAPPGNDLRLAQAKQAARRLVHGQHGAIGRGEQHGVHAVVKQRLELEFAVL
jgi:hypothetical protein